MEITLTRSQQLLYLLIKDAKIDDKTKLAKLEYFADFIHYAFFDKPITNENNVYQKRKQGALAVSFNSDLVFLKTNGIIDENPPYTFKVKKDIQVEFQPQELKTISYVLEKYSKLPYHSLVDICHKQDPYLSTKEDGVIEFFTAYNLVDEYPDFNK
jgi:uncharacterized phage-associated protein